MCRHGPDSSPKTGPQPDPAQAPAQGRLAQVSRACAAPGRRVWQGRADGRTRCRKDIGQTPGAKVTQGQRGNLDPTPITLQLPYP